MGIADKVGKSAAWIHYLQNFFVDEYDPTIEETYIYRREVDGTRVGLRIIDYSETPGPEEPGFAELLKQHKGFVVMYSITDALSFGSLQPYVDEVRQSVPGAPIIIAGNKIDLESERQVMKEQGETFARNNDAPFFEVSAKSKENIEPLFDETIRRALKYLEGSKPPSKAKANNRGCMLQ